MTLIFGMIATFLSSLAYSIMVHAPKKYLVWAGISGGVCGGVYLCAVEQGSNVVLATFVSALSAALLAHLFARKLKAPVTIFLIAGILPTVPGNGIYQIMYHLLIGNKERSLYYLTQTLEVAGAIAIAIFLMDTIFKVLRKGDWKQDSLKYIRKEKGS